MSSDSSSFFHLDERIQRFIWSEGWTELRDAQEAAIPLIVNADGDVIIAAATASGKTEAAFFPALTNLLKSDPQGLIAYVSPLKALINDQFQRLERLCEDLEVPVWPWHGDISATLKTRFLKERKGVLLITPESLEALLCNRGTSIGAIFERLKFFVLDELHVFIGTERGKQLQSLMHRIEKVQQRKIPRIGLSATLGDMQLASEFLRPGDSGKVSLVESKSTGNGLMILVKGYEEPLVIRPENEENDEQESITPVEIARHLFKTLRGSNNLIFPNSRKEVERYTYLLNNLCEAAQVKNEFWPHHGSLSKEIRSETEAALKQKEYPATAVCTNTLELGIDIGAIKCVAQISVPPSVASLRQRLGRSGRRKGEPAILRCYSKEDALTSKSTLSDQLRLRTVQTTAMISLLTEGWFEPPVASGVHLSTLIQQILSFIAQNGGTTASEAANLFCGIRSPFSGIDGDEFIELLRQLGKRELLMQDSSGVLLHGRIGEKLVNHYSFYAAFSADEEFRIVSGTRTLGSIPVSQLLVPGQRILFAGKTWHVDEINEQDKVIHVTRAEGGIPPAFSGGSGRVHTRIRQRMREIFDSSVEFSFLDNTAGKFLEEGRVSYNRLDLSKQILHDDGSQVMILTWLGDAANEAIACLLRCQGFAAMPAGIGIDVLKGRHTTENILGALVEISLKEAPPLDILFADAHNLKREKWDWALPDSLLRKSYASLYLDFEEAFIWLGKLAKTK